MQLEYGDMKVCDDLPFYNHSYAQSVGSHLWSTDYDDKVSMKVLELNLNPDESVVG